MGMISVGFPPKLEWLSFPPEELFKPDELPATLTATFQPGKLGIYADWDSTAMVGRVNPGSQAEHNGVKAMYLTEVDGQPFSVELLEKNVHGASPFTLGFAKESRQ